MSDGVTPVLRQVVVTARHSWSSGACPVRSWRRSTRVTVLRASSYSQALLDVLSCSQLGSISVWIGCGWRIRCSEQRSCVSHSNISSGTRHSRDVGSRCAWSVYAAPLSICDDGVVLCCVVLCCVVLCCVKVTEYPAAMISCTHMSAVRNRSGTTDSWYDDPI